MKTTFDIEGMTCSGCAKIIENQLNSIGCTDISVHFGLGEASVILPENTTAYKVATALTKVGYTSKERNSSTYLIKEKNWSRLKIYLFISSLFTIPLLLHMVMPSYSFINKPIVQLFLCLPVFMIGILQFGKSALFSILQRTANMDVLIFMGSAAAFIYSLYGTIYHSGTELAHHYLFYETSASIITLVLLGNFLEERAVSKTTSAVKDLQQLQVLKATLITNNQQTEEINAADILPGNLLLIKEGQKIPTDGIIIEGTGLLDESLLTGESIPVQKKINDQAIAGSILKSGLLKIKAIQSIEENTISKIRELVKNAQLNEPNIQRIGDRVSSIFVPIVIGIAVFTFFAGWQYADLSLQKALISSIAVLVISCPCAMGLATPTAVMVGVGKAAKKGALIKGGDTLEKIANARTVIFDKTGTLTSGTFKIKKIIVHKETENKVKSIIKSLETNSTHPIAISLLNSFKNDTNITLNEIKETKGIGISGKEDNGDYWSLGSARIIEPKSNADLVLLKNKEPAAELWIEDELKVSAQDLVHWLKSNGIHVILLSGDQKEKCKSVADQLGISEFYGERLPNEKLQFIDDISKKGIVVMVGDGINDAPSLTQAHVGISFGKAADIAQNAADVILLESSKLLKIKDVFTTSKLTLITIKQNLFWALFYNVVAIPIAAFGFLSPIIAAGSMAFSDLIVIGNSIRLKYKK